VTVGFGGLTALKEVDLAVPPATIVGLVGPNGAGKSTLFGVLSGLLKPSAGRVFLHGQDVTEQRPQGRAAAGLARTFQHPQLFSGLTISQHLSLAYRAKNEPARVWSDLVTMGSLRRSGAQETATVKELVELLGLGQIEDRPVLGLPLGSARMVELGRALATSPSVLLLDEPSSGLDSSETDQLEATLSRIARERGISVLLVEHDVELVMRLSHTVYVLDFGVIIAMGAPDEVRADPRVRAAYLGEQIETAEPGQADALIMVSEPPETLSEPEKPDSAAGPSQTSPALVVNDLSVHYGEVAALAGVTFRLDPGQALAVLGPNGAGKSSLARALSGLVRPSGGRVALGEQDITGWPAHQIRRAGLVQLPEGRGIFRGLTVIENLRMAASRAPGRVARQQAVDQALSTFPLLAERRRLVAGSLSGGEQQMLSLARVLMTGPKLIVADEMSLGLAPRMLDLVFEGLHRARVAGVSVIMIEQYVHRALAFADECLVLQRGKLAWQGKAGDAGHEVLTNYLGATMTAVS
jgi:ABC-type branched-subunit amino acid transport system ATPase component